MFTQFHIQVEEVVPERLKLRTSDTGMKDLPTDPDVIQYFQKGILIIEVSRLNCKIILTNQLIFS